MMRWLPMRLSGLTSRLAVRLVLLLSLALLPLGLVAVHTTLDTARAARQSTERALLGLTADSVTGKRALIESALASGRALGPLALERLEDPEDCQSLLQDYVARSGVYSFAGIIDESGLMPCSSSGASIDFSEGALFQRLSQRPAPSVSATYSGALTGQPEVIAFQPVLDGDEFRGFMAVSVARRTFQLMRQVSVSDAPDHTLLFNHEGSLISTEADNEIEGLEKLPEEVSLEDLSRRGNQVFRGTTVAGENAAFAVAELIPGRLFAIGTWPESALASVGVRAMIAPVLFPVLMWVASLGVVYFAVFHLVIRHLRSLNQQVRRFALGERKDDLKLPDAAPFELQELGSTFRKMTWIIARDEAERDADLAEKTVLLKEVHHRVKNNLQLIASILNLQMRQVEDVSARRVLQSVQDRVLGLATIHRSLYEESHLSALKADRVLDDILRQLLALGVPPGSGIRVNTDLAPVSIGADRLVPLSLLMSEAVTNALKYTGRPEEGSPWIEITLHAMNGMAELTVSNSTGAPVQDTKPSASTKLGAQLIEAFAMQLDGEVAQGAIADAGRGPGWQIRLRFPHEEAPLAAAQPPAEPDQTPSQD